MALPVNTRHVLRQSLLVGLSDDELSPAALVAAGRWPGASLA